MIKYSPSKKQIFGIVVLFICGIILTVLSIIFILKGQNFEFYIFKLHTNKWMRKKNPFP